MQKGDLVRVVQPCGWQVPIFNGPNPSASIGRATPGETYIVVRQGLKKHGVGVASAGWSGDAEIVHPDHGLCLIEQAYLEVVNEAETR